MGNVWRLTRIQLLGVFGLNRALHAKEGKERRRALLAGLGFIAVTLMVAAMSFSYSYGLALAFDGLGRLELLLAVMMAAASLVTFFTTVYKAGDVLFRFKDYELIMSLPVKTGEVVASRVLFLYMLNVVFSLLVMLPAGAVYAVMAQPPALYYAAFILTLPFIPLLPIVAAAAVGAGIGWISSRFKASRLIGLILTFGVLLAVMAGSFGLGGQEQQLTDAAAWIAESIGRWYPPAGVYMAALHGYEMGPLLLWVAFSLLILLVFSAGLGRYFKAIHTGLTTNAARGTYTMKPLKAASPFHALFRKELRRYFSSSAYVLNTAMGLVLLLAMSVSLLAVGPDVLGEVTQAPQLSQYLGGLAPVLVSFFIVLSCTTSSSISLEGGQLWIVKSAPVSKAAVLLSKAAVNLVLTVPVSAVSSVMLMIGLRTGWAESVLLLALPLIYACYSALAGLVVNLKFPKLDWQSETAVIKQSGASLVGILAGIAGLVPPVALLILVPGVNSSVLLAASGLLMLMVSLLLLRYLQTQGERLFQAL